MQGPAALSCGRLTSTQTLQWGTPTEAATSESRLSRDLGQGRRRNVGANAQQIKNSGQRRTGLQDASSKSQVTKGQPDAAAAGAHSWGNSASARRSWPSRSAASPTACHQGQWRTGLEGAEQVEQSGLGEGSGQRQVAGGSKRQQSCRDFQTCCRLVQIKPYNRTALSLTSLFSAEDTAT